MSSLTEKVKASVDIVELVKEYLPLKPSGRNFKALCPFHSEKTPSFMVSREKQIFHCFGCGAGGDSVTFLMKHENLTFQDAINALGKKAGIDIPEIKSDGGYASKLYEIMDAATQFYERYLFSEEGKSAWRYLIKRGLEMSQIKKFRIGFSPSLRDILYKFLVKKGFAEKDIERAGLITKKGDGYSDWFRGRIIFPIMTEGGKIVAFGGRVMGEIEPKYLNSPETPIYRKGAILYGFNLARQKLIKDKKALVVEGYMDLISLFRHGFDFTVATLGTSLTAVQLRLLKRFSPELIFGYDADRGGEEATLRAIEEALKLDFSIKVLELPSGEDPEDYLTRHGRDAMAALIKDAPDFLNYRIKIIEKAHPPRDNMEKIKIVRALLSTLVHFTSPLEIAVYLRQLSERYSIPEETLRIELKNLKERYKISPKSALTPTEHFSREREVMKVILSDGELSIKARRYIMPEDFEDGTLRELMRSILKFDKAADIDIDALLNDLNEERWRSTVTRFLLEEPEYTSASEFLDEFILKIIKKRQSKRIDSKLKEIEREEKNGNLAGVREKQREYEELIRRKGGTRIE